MGEKMHHIQMSLKVNEKSKPHKAQKEVKSKEGAGKQVPEVTTACQSGPLVLMETKLQKAEDRTGLQITRNANRREKAKVVENHGRPPAETREAKNEESSL